MPEIPISRVRVDFWYANHQILIGRVYSIETHLIDCLDLVKSNKSKNALYFEIDANYPNILSARPAMGKNVRKKVFVPFLVQKVFAPLFY